VRPKGSEGLDRAKLAALAKRDSVIGVTTLWARQGSYQK
jgi:hypothetical protein